MVCAVQSFSNQDYMQCLDISRLCRVSMHAYQRKALWMHRLEAAELRLAGLCLSFPVDHLPYSWPAGHSPPCWHTESCSR